MKSEQNHLLTVTVFGSASPRRVSVEYEAAYELGRELAARGLALCNGGYGGTMEAAAKGAREAGGHVTGVTLSSIPSRKANPFLDTVIPCPDLMARISTLLETGDGYAVLPGGPGTLAEIGMMLECINKKFIPARPFVFLGEFWDPLLELMCGEDVLRRESGWEGVEGVEVLGSAARTDSPAAAAEFLAKNLRRPAPPA